MVFSEYILEETRIKISRQHIRDPVFFIMLNILLFILSNNMKDMKMNGVQY
jgi:hypothetical protein